MCADVSIHFRNKKRQTAHAHVQNIPDFTLSAQQRKVVFVNFFVYSHLLAICSFPYVGAAFVVCQFSFQRNHFRHGRLSVGTKQYV